MVTDQNHLSDNTLSEQEVIHIEKITQLFGLDEQNVPDYSFKSSSSESSSFESNLSLKTSSSFESSSSSGSSLSESSLLFESNSSESSSSSKNSLFESSLSFKTSSKNLKTSNPKEKSEENFTKNSQFFEIFL
ncbi:hypothetical protein C1646_764788 [Rhizophagus diaphanus]|nr:hypothetical protein C1646_764788 [Rhizophagus diaphanus] [Rhizophagus sp. MUCL 43196]